jgi:hypothetical protein
MRNSWLFYKGAAARMSPIILHIEHEDKGDNYLVEMNLSTYVEVTYINIVQMPAHGKIMLQLIYN